MDGRATDIIETSRASRNKTPHRTTRIAHRRLLHRGPECILGGDVLFGVVFRSRRPASPPASLPVVDCVPAMKISPSCVGLHA
jgi:hypothetical protein